MEFSELCYLDETGYHYADFPTVHEWVKQNYRNTYGADIYIEPDSQDGVNLALLAKSYYDMEIAAGSTINSFLPRSAQGTGLSRIVKINGISRRLPTFSTATGTIVGTVGTIILNGIAQDTLGQKWLLPAVVVIPMAGFIDVTLTAELAGAVNALSNTINKIFTNTLGWQTVNNSLAAVTGDPVETDAELRVRQAQSTANPSQTVLEGTAGAVGNLLGVTAVQPYENDTEVTDSNGLVEHSICIVVDGTPDEVEVCETILYHKTPGCNTNGNISHTVYDSKGVPSLIKYQSAVHVAIKVKVTGDADLGWSPDYAALIKQAVADYINGLKIGESVLISKLYAPAYLTGTPQNSTFDISNLEIAKVANAFGTINVPIAFNERATCSVGDVTILIS